MIKTGIYHSDISDKEKEDLHESWLLGKVKVVCATIGMVVFFFRVLSRGQNKSRFSSTAFGLGINKADVRFVLHHSVRPMFSGPTKTPRLTKSFQDACASRIYIFFLKIFLIDFC